MGQLLLDIKPVRQVNKQIQLLLVQMLVEMYRGQVQLLLVMELG
jgi:hypothetical protein